LKEPDGGFIGATSASMGMQITSTVHSNVQFVCDLLISTVRENVEEDMRFTFQVISPGQRVYVLQGECEEDTREWVRVIRQQIEFLLGKSNEEDVKHSDNTLLRCTDYFHPTANILTAIRAENLTCADCNAENPDWASLNLGILICIECSGIHRSLGTHISKVRSLLLDKWTRNTLNLIERIGNKNSNTFWEENLNVNGHDLISQKSFHNEQTDVGFITKPVATSRRDEKEAFITAKYINRAFVRTVRKNDINQMLYHAASIGDLYNLAYAVATGGNINYINPLDNHRHPIHAACLGGHAICVEFLCQNNATVDTMDDDSKMPMDYANQISNAAIIDILVQKLERDLQL
jgi:hypothetical protein